MSTLKSLSKRVSKFEKLFTDGLELDEQVALLSELSEGEVSAAELYGCAQFLKAKMHSVFIQEPAIDIVRCGGSAHATFNIAIIAAFIASGAGMRVVKHCIRSLDDDGGIVAVLKALELNLASESRAVANQLKQYGISFLVAEDFHPLLSRVAKAQQVLTQQGNTTFINRVLPLCNPAEVKKIAIGVANPHWMSAYAEVMPMLGIEEAYIFSSQGVDAVTNFEATEYLYFDKGLNQEASWPKDLMGMYSGKVEALCVAGVEQNAAVIESILENKELGVKRDVALMNAAVAICLGYPERLSYVDALGMAQESLESGAALACLRGLQA